MKNLLIIAQKVDADDDLLGFFVEWIKEFAKSFDNVYVIALEKGKVDLPLNVRIFSLGKERRASKMVQAYYFYRYLFTLITRVDGIFAHMSPIFVIAAWPVAFIYRKRIILWYLHRSVTFKLKVAEKLCYKIVTAARESLKFNSGKIIETGHGINIEKFRTERDRTMTHELRPFRILSVGRISPIKNFETLVEAAKILRDDSVDFEIKIIGKPVMQKDNGYLQSLQLLITNYGLQSLVHLVGFVPYSKIEPYYKEADIIVGLTPDGGIDKTILEGMASGCFVLTSNNINKKYFGHFSDALLFDYGNAVNLAEKIESLSRMSVEKKSEIRGFLLMSVTEKHNLPTLISRLNQLYR